MGLFSFIGNAYTSAIDACKYRAEKKALYNDGLGNKVLIALGTLLNKKDKASGDAVAKKTLAELRAQRPAFRVVTPPHALEAVYPKSAQRLDNGDVRIVYNNGTTRIVDPSSSLAPAEPPRQQKRAQDYGALARLEFRLLDQEGQFKANVTDNAHARRHMLETLTEVISYDLRDRDTARFAQLMGAYNERLEGYLQKTSTQSSGNVVRLSNADRKVAMTLDAIAKFRVDYHWQNDRMRSFSDYLLDELGGRDIDFVKPKEMHNGAFVTRHGTMHYDVLYAALKNDQNARARLTYVADKTTPWSLAGQKRYVA